MLAAVPGSLQIDATLGGGGHAERILEASDPDGRLLGLDADGAAIARVRARLGAALRRPPPAPPGELPRARATSAPAEGFGAVDGCLFDLGLSSFQLADAGRGFGFRTGGPLDMRFDTGRGVPAAELLATPRRRRADGPLPALRRGAVRGADRPGHRGGPPRARPIQTAEELAALVERVAPARAPGRRRVHPATRVFQALRIAVNEELDALEAGLAAALDLLRPGGRLVVLSYHSLEDRIVKRFFQAERRGCTCPPEVARLRLRSGARGCAWS